MYNHNVHFGSVATLKFTQSNQLSTSIFSLYVALYEQKIMAAKKNTASSVLVDIIIYKIALRGFLVYRNTVL